MKKILNLCLLISFVLTILVPFTGIIIHKMASVFFLIFSFIHLFVYKDKLSMKRILLMIIIVICFVSGIFGMIFDHIPFILNFHKVLSILLVFFLAIHIYIFHKKMKF